AISFQDFGRKLDEDLMGDPPRRTMMLAVHANEVAAGFVENPLQFLDGLGGLAAEHFLLGLGEPLAGLRRFSAQRGRLRRRLREYGRLPYRYRERSHKEAKHGVIPAILLYCAWRDERSHQLRIQNADRGSGGRNDGRKRSRLRRPPR